MPFDGVETPYTHLEKFDRVIGLVESPDRWAKHAYINPRGQHCLIGALNAVGVGTVFKPIILKTIAEMSEREFCCIESFNDHPETQHRDVLALLYRIRGHIIAGKFDPPASTFGPRRDRPRVSMQQGRLSGLWRRMFG